MTTTPETQHLTLEEIDLISKLEAKATPGPWEAVTDTQPRILPFNSEQSRQVRSVDATLSKEFGHRVLVPHGLVHHTDGDLIAAARNALPALLSMVRRLVELESELTEQRKLVSLGDELCRAAIRCGLHTWQNIPVDNDAKRRAVALGAAMFAYHNASPTCEWPADDTGSYKPKTLDQLLAPPKAKGE